MHVVLRRLSAMKKQVFRIDSDGFNGVWYPAGGTSSRNRNADSVRKRDWKKHGSKRVWLR